MYRVHAIRPPFRELAIKVGEIRSKSVPVQIDNVIGINGMNCRDASVIPKLKPRVGGISWLIQDVVSRYPWVAFVMCSKLLPQPNSTILKVLVNPKTGYMSRIIRMPILLRD